MKVEMEKKKSWNRQRLRLSIQLLKLTIFKFPADLVHQGKEHSLNFRVLLPQPNQFLTLQYQGRELDREFPLPGSPPSQPLQPQ